MKFQYRETSRADQQLIEKDSAMEHSYLAGNTRHYIIADKTETKILWANGDFECRASGNISEQEAREIIKSIYVEG